MHAEPNITAPVRSADHVSLLAALGITFDPKLRQAAKGRRESPARSAQREAGAMVIPLGSRNSGLASIAGGMRARGASEQEILAGLVHVNAEQVDPPLDDEEVAGIAASISKYPPGPASSAHARSLNDTGNAVRLVGAYGARIRYVVQMGDWYLWDGTRWRRDAKLQMVEIAKEVARLIYNEAATCTNPNLAKSIAKHANKSLDAARIAAMVDLARSDQAVVVSPTELDRHEELLGVANGVVDLRTGEFRAARPEDLVTKHSPVAYDPSAKCPTWYRFLNRVMNNRTSRAKRARGKALVKYLQRVAGYALSGRTDEQALFFLFGFGANGKTTFLKIIESLLGDELSCQLPYDALIVRKQPRGATPEFARLVGRRAVFTNEVEDGTQLAETQIKQMTGQDTMTARHLYCEPFDFEPTHKLFIAGNHKPIIRGDDHGIWRRIQLVPFEETIPEAERDPRLLEKLRAELPGILNWALRGYRLWRRERLSPPAAVREACDTYREEMDILGDWVRDCCVVGPGHTVGAADAYRNYGEWAKENGYKPMGSKGFYRKLAERFPRIRTRRGNDYDGLALAFAVSVSGGGTCGASGANSVKSP